MDEQNPMSAPVVPTPAPAPVPPPMPVMPSVKPASSKRWLWIALIAVVVLAGGAYGWMMLYPTVPAPEVTATPMVSVAATVIPSSEWKSYTDGTYGFSFWHPAYMVAEAQVISAKADSSLKSSARLQSTDKTSGSINISVYTTKLISAQTLYEGRVPVAKLATTTVDGRTAYMYKDGDAGCWSTDYYVSLSDTSYVRIGFFDCDGDVAMVDKNIDLVLASLKFSATPGPIPAGSPLGGVPLSQWASFSSKYFTLSFKTPSGFEVIDSQNSIRIAQSPYTTRPIGDDNAFFVLTRYAAGDTMAKRKAAYLGANPDSYTQWTMVIDGTTFPVVTGMDPGRFEGTSAGRVMAVFFEKSFVEIIQMPATLNLNFDPLSLGSRILSTFKFTK